MTLRRRRRAQRQRHAHCRRRQRLFAAPAARLSDATAATCLLSLAALRREFECPPRRRARRLCRIPPAIVHARHLRHHEMSRFHFVFRRHGCATPTLYHHAAYAADIHPPPLPSLNRFPFTTPLPCPRLQPFILRLYATTAI